MDRLTIIETLKHLPDMLEAEIAGLSPAALRARPSEDAWSITEVIGHLRDHVAMTQKRIYMVWSMFDPQLPGYDGEALVREGNYRDADAMGMIEDLREMRLHTIGQLNRAVDWSRTGSLPGVGRRSLKQIGERAIDHEAEHIAQVQAIKAATGAGAAR
jgi:hypothetical protein